METKEEKPKQGEAQNVALTSIAWKQLPAKDSLVASVKPMLTLAVNDSTVDTISKKIKEIDAFCKAVKNERMDYTRKLDEIKRQYMDQEKMLTAELLADKETLQKRVSEFLTEKERARQEAERERARIEAEAALARQEAEVQKLAEEQKNADMAAMFGQQAQPQAQAAEIPPAADPVILPPKIEKTVVSNVRQVKVARWKITNPNILPREFLTVDESKIRSFANDKMRCGFDLKSIRIDGIEFYEEISAQLR